MAKKIKVTKGGKDWEKASLNPDYKEVHKYRNAIGNKFSYTYAGIFDMYNNSLYDNGKLKPKYKKLQQKYIKEGYY